MRDLFLLIVLVFSWPNLRAQSMPDLENVVEAFFKQHRLDSRQFYALGFERRPDGYYAVYKQNGIDVTDRVLFYDATTPSIGYEDIGLFYGYFGRNNNPQRTDVDELVAAYLRYLGKYTTETFARQPYYGYDGWYKDAIAYFEDKAALNEDELHALARAQSVAASSLLSENRGFDVEQERFELPMGQNALTDIQVITYRELANKCLASYRALKQRKPDYLTPVGTATVKYANEVMDVFLTLLYFQNTTTAMDVLEENLYPAHLLINARNLLQSCPPNAILITYGDNDTYPLYYLQAMGSFRKDVLIANASLLNISRYRLMFQQEPLWAEPIQTRLPANHFEEEVTYWGKYLEASDTLRMETIYEQLLKAENYYERVFTLSGSTITIPVSEDAETLGLTEGPEFMLWEAAKNKVYIFPPEIFVADALTANQWRRPVCFTNTVGYEVLKPWHKHLAREGLVYRLYPETFVGRITDFQTTAINMDYSLDFWYKQMAFDTTTVVNTLDQLSFYANNLMTATAMVKRLDQQGKSEEALSFCQFLMEKYPDHIKAWDGSWGYILQILLEMEDGQALAKMLFDKLLENLEDGYIHESDEDGRNRLRVQLQQINMEKGWD